MVLTLKPVEKFHVSKMNVRHNEPFGDSEEDKNLAGNLREGNIIQPFKARPEGNGFGVYVGRRRFLAKKEAGAKHFVVGVDCLIEKISDEKAREASWIENLDFLRKQMNPITRAKVLKEIVRSSSTSLRSVAKRLRIPPSTLSEWMKVLQLSPKMQNLLAKGLLSYKDGLMIARITVDTELQDQLAEVLETQGKRSFKKLVKKLSMGHQLTKKRAKNEKNIDAVDKVFWKELTKSLRAFAGYWPDLCTLKEWEDEEAYYLSLQVTAPKHSDEPIENPGGLETLLASEAPEICGLCGEDILEGDQFAEKEGLYYCAKCVGN